MKKFLLIGIATLVVLVGVLWKWNVSLRSENERLEGNQTALMEKATYYETEAGKSAASVQKLELSYSELKNNYEQVCKTADELNIKVKRLQAASTTATHTEVKVITEIRDSIIYRNGTVDSLKYLKWKDAWVNVEGIIKKDSVALDVLSNDTIIQIIHRVPHRFWFIKWGTKAIRQEIISTNPHTKITFAEYIELKK